MHPLFIIARREFLQRVRQKSFWVMLLLGPFFLLVIMIVPIGLAMQKETSSEILFLDESGLLSNYLYSSEDLKLVEASGTVHDAYSIARKGGYAGLIWIGKTHDGWQTRFYPAGIAAQPPALIKAVIEKRITEYELGGRNEVILPKVNFRTASITEVHKGQPDSTMGFVAGLFSAVLVLVFINQYAHMVLRGIVEEKQNRISELILTSVKPLHFISGKIAGIASVAFLQIFIWLILSGFISFSVNNYFRLERFSDKNLAETLSKAQDVPQTLEMNTMINAVASVNVAGILLGFLFYFVVGYLLFSTLFAMVGIFVGSDTDAQQMAIPFTLPLALPVILMQYITDNPESGLTTFLSVFPFTSPTAMLLRLPGGVPPGQLLVSGLVLILSLVFSSFAAARIYRTGILMYGKKFTISELLKWAVKS